MKQEKPKSVRTVGIILAVFSAFMILNGVLGFFMIDFLLDSFSDWEALPENKNLFNYIKPLLILSIIIGLIFLVAGIFIARYKAWARMLAQVIAVLYLLSIWYIAIFLAPYNPFDRGVLSIDSFVGPLFWSIPIILLIRFLNKEKVKILFT